MKKNPSWDELLNGVDSNCITCGHLSTMHEVTQVVDTDVDGNPTFVDVEHCVGSNGKKRKHKCKCQKFR
jgi:hypothetical protein